MDLKGAALILLAAVGLASCGNGVKSEAPLFSSADEIGAPVFRQGIWIGDDPDCAVDITTPHETWPKCADPVVIGPKGLKDQKLMEGADSRVAAGDPIILQMGDAGGYDYLALRVTKTDGRRRATAFRVWTILCGPPPKGENGEPPPQKVTSAPLPGLEVRGDDCFAHDQASVRRAAVASEAWDETKMSVRWAPEAKR